MFKRGFTALNVIGMILGLAAGLIYFSLQRHVLTAQPEAARSAE
jgi:uncharacterized membrane protein YesL